MSTALLVNLVAAEYQVLLSHCKTAKEVVRLHTETRDLRRQWERADQFEAWNATLDAYARCNAIAPETPRTLVAFMLGKALRTG